MPLPAFLLRLLLCLSLVLNGSGYAAAATGMQLEHLQTVEQHHAVASAVDDDSLPPCHSNNGADAMPGMPHDADSHPDIAQHGDKPDCCKASLCACDCLQHASLAMTTSQPAAVAVLRTASVSRIPAGHATPLLSNRIRPPIG